MSPKNAQSTLLKPFKSTTFAQCFAIENEKNRDYRSIIKNLLQINSFFSINAFVILDNPTDV